MRFTDRPAADDSFNNLRRNNEITEREFADFMGISVNYAFNLTTGRQLPTASDWSGLRAMIAAR